MLRYAFEMMQCVRMQFTIDETNQRSRAAILPIGAQQEYRAQDGIVSDGRKRNSARFSIIDTEGPGVKAA